MRAAGLIAVAGQSRRMGAFKPLLPIDGIPMIVRTADVFSNAGVADLFVVVGREGEAVASALSGRNVRILWNHAYAETDMFASAQIGLNAIRKEGGFDGAFLLPGDMPAVPSSLLPMLVDELESGNWDVVFPSDGTRRLHPPLIRASCFDSIIAYRGRDGMRGAFHEMDGRIGYVVTSEAGCGIDVDTPDDYARVKAHLAATKEGTPTL